LISIAHNVCRQRFRQASRRPNEVLLDADRAEALVPSEDAPTAADIQRALGHLALNQREALVMRELEGRSYAEIAGVLGLSVSAVETLLFRARRALREQLEGSLTCEEAEEAISRQLDGRLSRAERSGLRAHLRECGECERLARRQRAQRNGWKALAVAPLPPSLGSLFGGGGAGVGLGLGGGIVAKVAAVTAAAAVVGGGGYAIVRHESPAPNRPVAAPATRVRHTAKPAHHRTAPRTRSHRATGATTLAAAAAAASRAVETVASTLTAIPPVRAAAHPQHPVHPLHTAAPVHAPKAVRTRRRPNGTGLAVGKSTPPSYGAACPANPVAAVTVTTTETVPAVAVKTRCPKPGSSSAGHDKPH